MIFKYLPPYLFHRPDDQTGKRACLCDHSDFNAKLRCLMTQGTEWHVVRHEFKTSDEGLAAMIRTVYRPIGFGRR